MRGADIVTESLFTMRRLDGNSAYAPWSRRDPCPGRTVAHAGPYRARSVYRYAIEDSIYLDERFRGHGIRPALLARCEAGPWRRWWPWWPAPRQEKAPARWGSAP